MLSVVLQPIGEAECVAPINGILKMRHHETLETIALEKCCGLFISPERGCITTCSEPFFWLIHRFDGGLVQIEVPEKSLFVHPDCTVQPHKAFFQLKIVQLPVVDIRALVKLANEDDDSVLVVQQALLDAAQDVGAFYITGVPEEMFSAAESVIACASADFTASPTADKFGKFTIASSTGLVKTNFSPPVHEPIVAPQFLHLPQNVVSRYFELACQVADSILNVLADSTSFLEDSKRETYALLRLICYPPSCSSGGYLETHTDKSWITVLKASSFAGLQFLDCDGESYFDVGDIDGAFLVNVGDALQMLSGGRFVSRPHRATNPFTESNRISLPLFVEPRLWPSSDAQQQLVAISLE